ncbi:MAG: hypothetical protein O7E52_02230, partial [Candidatus Poribacteria bacterium]|nr:hypothetical protein [Candidatus Poribacteria bacterium]
MKPRQLYMTFFIAFSLSSVVFADRGDDLLPLVQSEALRGHIIALQENIQQGPQQIVYRTRSAFHRDAA